jgi:hypothetical protein
MYWTMKQQLVHHAITGYVRIFYLKSHEKVGEMWVEGDGLGPN